MSAFSLLTRIEALVMDIDGVLTDGTVTWSASGDELKTYSYEDIMGLSRARAAGIALGLISGEDGPLVDLLAGKIGAAFVASGCKDKARALKEFGVVSGISMERTAYIGDDVNDLEALSLAGVSAAPSNAQAAVKQVVTLVLDLSGGHGAVRRFVEMLITARNGEPIDRVVES